MEYSDSALRMGGYLKVFTVFFATSVQPLWACQRLCSVCGYYSQPVSCYWERPIKEGKLKKKERTDEEVWTGWIKSCLFCHSLYPFRKSQYKNGLHKKIYMNIASLYEKSNACALCLCSAENIFHNIDIKLGLIRVYLQ